MNKFLVIVALTGLLPCGAQSFKLSEKEYENIDLMLEFGVQVFLNCLDKVREATEKVVKDDMLRTNRIAVQNYWNSFKETANKISVEERGKEGQDDLIVAVRIVRKVVLHYMDDVKKMFHTLSIDQNIHQFLPDIKMFKGTIERAKVTKIWGTLAANYFHDAPPIKSDPLEFLCYQLSTNSVEIYIANVLKVGLEVITLYKEIHFDQIYERAWNILREVSKKFDDIQRIEREKEKDNFLLKISVISRVFVFYWDKFLNSTDTPLLDEKYANITRQMEDQDFLQTLYITLYEVLTPIMEWESVKDAWRLHSDFVQEFYLIGLGVIRNIYYFTDEERCSRTVRAVGMSTVVHIYPIYQKLTEMGVFSEIKRLYLRAVNVTIALAGDKEFEHFRETFFEKWKSFMEELNTLVKEERHKSHILLPQVRAIGQMSLLKFVAFLDRVNTDVDDNTLKSLSMNWDSMKANCSNKLLASGVITQDQLDEAKRIFFEDILEFFGKTEDLTQGMDRRRAEDLITAGVKAIMVGLNFIYTPLIQAWDILAV